MSSHLLGVLEPSVVLQVNRYAGSARLERIAGRGSNLGSRTVKGGRDALGQPEKPRSVVQTLGFPWVSPGLTSMPCKIRFSEKSLPAARIRPILAVFR